MKKITMYKCDYCGKLINTTEECAEHEQRHRNVDGANEMLRNGATLEEINHRYGIWNSIPEHLKNATKDHGFTISYWQCCNKPAYTINRIDMDGRLYVFGIGSWSGGYGNSVRIDSTNLEDIHEPCELFVDPGYGTGRWQAIDWDGIKDEKGNDDDKDSDKSDNQVRTYRHPLADTGTYIL